MGREFSTGGGGGDGGGHVGLVCVCACARMQVKLWSLGEWGGRSGVVVLFW